MWSFWKVTVLELHTISVGGWFAYLINVNVCTLRWLWFIEKTFKEFPTESRGYVCVLCFYWKRSHTHFSTNTSTSHKYLNIYFIHTPLITLSLPHGMFVYAAWALGQRSKKIQHFPPCGHTVGQRKPARLLAVWWPVSNFLWRHVNARFKPIQFSLRFPPSFQQLMI